MRTWFNALPPRGSSPGQRPWIGFVRAAQHDKKRVPAPDQPDHRTRSPNETGCPEGITARRTRGALL